MRRIEFRKRSFPKNRRGIAIVWLILWGSIFLTFFCGFFEVATLWQAQVELNDSLDAAALAAVSEWKTQRDMSNFSTKIPRDVGIEYAAANPVMGDTVSLGDNYDPGNSPNENSLCSGNLVFGNLTSSGSDYDFNAGTSGGLLAVRAQATIPLYGFCNSLFGVTFLNVSASSTAFYDTGSGRPRLVRVTSYSCSD